MGETTATTDEPKYCKNCSYDKKHGRDINPQCPHCYEKQNLPLLGHISRVFCDACANRVTIEGMASLCCDGCALINYTMTKKCEFCRQHFENYRFFPKPCPFCDPLFQSVLNPAAPEFRPAPLESAKTELLLLTPRSEDIENPPSCEQIKSPTVHQPHRALTFQEQMEMYSFRPIESWIEPSIWNYPPSWGQPPNRSSRSGSQTPPSDWSFYCRRTTFPTTLSGANPRFTGPMRRLDQQCFLHNPEPFYGTKNSISERTSDYVNTQRLGFIGDQLNLSCDAARKEQSARQNASNDVDGQIHDSFLRDDDDHISLSESEDKFLWTIGVGSWIQDL